MTPEAAKPVPDTDAALTVTAEPPVADNTTVCVAGMFVTTSPKSTLVVLTLSEDDPELSCSVTLCPVPPALAVRIAVSAELAGEILAVKFVLLAPAGTVTEPGTFTSELLLERLTADPPLAAAVFNVTVQLSVPEPVNERLAQLSPLSTGTPVPLTPTTVEVPPAELLVTDTCPLAAPAAVGSNCTLSVSVWPGDNVAGSTTPAIEKPVPLSDAALTVTGMVPIDERTSGFVTTEFTGTLPKVRLDALAAKTAVAASSWTLNVCATPPALAVSMAACAVATAVALAENCALVAPDGTVIDAGTARAPSLLARLTTRPLLPAAAFRLTVQASTALPRIDPFTQSSPVSTGTPMPLSATEAVLPFDALLAIVSWPLADPDAEGPNWIVIVTLALAPTVIGMLPPPLIEKGCPVKFNCEIETAAAPLFVTVMTLLAVLPTATCPKLTVLDDTVRVPATELFLTNDPEHPLRTRPQVKVSRPIKPNFKWRILSSGRAQNLYRRTREIYRQGKPR